MATVSGIKAKALVIGAWPAWGKIVALNAAVFVIMRLSAGVSLMVSGGTSTGIDGVLMLPSDFYRWAARPWTAVTYMFTQYEVLHLAVNMLWLYLFATVCSDRFSGRRMAVLYLCGGLAGAMAYMVFASFVPAAAGHNLTGASAAVMAVVGAALVSVPERKVTLIMFGPVRLKWIVAVSVVLLAAGDMSGSYGSLVAHAAGFVSGISIVLWWRREKRCARNIHRSFPAADICGRTGDAEVLDAILDKVRRSGYGALTARERVRLFEVSQRIQSKK